MIKYSIKTMFESLFYEPNENSEVIDEILNGWEFEILDNSIKNFYLIKTFYGYIGYLKKEVSIKINLDFEKYEKIITLKNFTDLNYEPKIKSTVLKTLIKGSILYYKGKINSYYCQVITCDGKIGFVRLNSIKRHFITCSRLDLNFLDKKTEYSTREKILNTAKSYLSCQYRWGGKTPLGIDCSGLVFMSYFINGIIIERDTISTSDETKTNYEELKTSDIIYLNNHVVMYIDNEKYIHSCFENNGVFMNSFLKNSSLYNEKLENKIIWCRKIL
ncbi:MAG: C40 family peptidase [Clostridiales bacterium]|jgi:hypothetical protein|nr:C40 family peptidase [Clostridiales bacterium]